MFFPVDNVCSADGFVLHGSSEQHAHEVIFRVQSAGGSHRDLRLRWSASPRSNHLRWSFVTERFQQTARFWKAWIAKSKYQGRWREMVNRSALMLKLLISRKYGSLIAAPTFSLPENIGGVRNWDYRFTWLRDATFTLYALIRLGFVDETEAFIEWLRGRLE